MTSCTESKDLQRFVLARPDRVRISSCLPRTSDIIDICQRTPFMKSPGHLLIMRSFWRSTQRPGRDARLQGQDSRLTVSLPHHAIFFELYDCCQLVAHIPPVLKTQQSVRCVCASGREPPAIREKAVCLPRATARFISTSSARSRFFWNHSLAFLLTKSSPPAHTTASQVLHAAHCTRQSSNLQNWNGHTRIILSHDQHPLVQIPDQRVHVAMNCPGWTIRG